MAGQRESNLRPERLGSGNGFCSGGGSSTISLLPSIAKESLVTQSQLCARVAALRVEIRVNGTPFYRGFLPKTYPARTPIHFIFKRILTYEESDSNRKGVNPLQDELDIGLESVCRVGNGCGGRSS
jgi:hypothetical protein